MQIYTHILEKRDYSSYLEKLNHYERNKAMSLFFKKDANAYIAKELIKRRSLEIDLEIPTENLVFQKNQYGKPFISDKIHFNTSRAKEAAIAGVSKDPIGIDIDRVEARGCRA